MKEFCKSLNEHVMKIINFIKKIEICYTCGKMFENRYTNDNKYRKVRDHCHYAGEYRGD